MKRKITVVDPKTGNKFIFDFRDGFRTLTFVDKLERAKSAYVRVGSYIPFGKKRKAKDDKPRDMQQ